MEAVFYEHVVQYYETDRMGCVHHSNYIRWFEEARTWLMAEGGFGYDRMEALGVMSPVLKAEAEYRTMVPLWGDGGHRDKGRMVHWHPHCLFLRGAGQGHRGPALPGAHRALFYQ